MYKLCLVSAFDDSVWCVLEEHDGFGELPKDAQMVFMDGDKFRVEYVWFED